MKNRNPGTEHRWKKKIVAKYDISGMDETIQQI